MMYWALAQQALGHKEAAVRRLEHALSDPAPRGLAKSQLYIGLCAVHLFAGDLYPLLRATQRYLAFAPSMGNTGGNWFAGWLRYEWNDIRTAMAHFERVAEHRRISRPLFDTIAFGISQCPHAGRT